MTPMNVLVVESETGQTAADADALRRAGNAVFRCFNASGQTREGADPFVCVGVTDGTCPLDRGIDVAMMPQPNGSPTIFTAGALCARRHGVPVATVAPGDDAVAACEAAIERGYDVMRSQIGHRLVGVLDEANLRFDEISLSFETDGPNLRVVVTGPDLSATLRERLAVRVTDAIRDTGRVFDKKSVIYKTG